MLKKFLSSFPLKTLKLSRKSFLKAPVHSRNHQEAASGAQKVSKFFSLEDFETLQKKFFEGPSALQKSPGGCLLRSEIF